MLKPIFIKFLFFTRSTSNTFSFFIRWGSQLWCGNQVLFPSCHVWLILYFLRVIPLEIQPSARSFSYGIYGWPQWILHCLCADRVISCWCQIGIERSDYLGDKISVGVARPSHILGQSVPCDGWHSILGTRVRHMCTESGIRAQGLITRATASWQLTNNTGIRSTQLTPLVMRSKCSWLITPSAAASTQYSY